MWWLFLAVQYVRSARNPIAKECKRKWTCLRSKRRKREKTHTQEQLKLMALEHTFVKHATANKNKASKLTTLENPKTSTVFHRYPKKWKRNGRITPSYMYENSKVLRWVDSKKLGTWNTSVDWHTFHPRAFNVALQALASRQACKNSQPKSLPYMQKEVVFWEN